MPRARRLWDHVVDDFLGESMSGSYWRRNAVAFVSKHAHAHAHGRAIVATIGIVALYRIGNYIPLPGVNSQVLALLDAGGSARRSRISSPGATYFVRLSSH